ncbi:hypothetical protein BD779DRAFT_1729277 [Infundibulicybe gibba]|nr:hypothetical protein BD779DRAFT_1729277 [Infundibulicybe gibba]
MPLYLRMPILPRITMVCSLRRILAFRGGGNPYQRLVELNVERRAICHSLACKFHYRPPRLAPPVKSSQFAGAEIPTIVTTRLDPFISIACHFRYLGSDSVSRLGSDTSPANLNAGEDSLIPLCSPWQVSFPGIARFSGFTTKYRRNYLLWCGVITWVSVTRSSRATILSPDETFRIRIPRLFSDNRKHSKRRQCDPPYHVDNGFRVSSHPAASGQNTLVMRLLKIIEPVICAIPRYDGYMPPPEEGSLLYNQSATGCKFRSKLWIYDVDRDSLPSAGLRVLHDISPLRTVGVSG